MALPAQLDVALKEWAAVCDALASGRQMVLLRKGGIHELAGEFEIEHRQFLLFPTYLHQNLQMLKPEAHGSFKALSSEPEQITISAAGEITNIIRVGSRAEIDAIEADHIWTPPLIDMRFNYKPEKPLYLLIVRAYRLPKSVTIQNTPIYAGCKSWVPLDQPIATHEATSVLDEITFAQRRGSILDTIADAPA
jgi:hypothetical protein